MIVLSDPELGYYLKYFDANEEEWLSLGDRGRLQEVVCPDDREASAGLFVRPEAARLAIREFCQSGTRASEVAWIRPENMPDGGNW